MASTTFESVQKIKTENIDVVQISNDLILGQVKNLRSNKHLQEGDSSSDQTLGGQSFPTLIESYCHTFYRIVGLPVISANKVDFYNPGYFGSEDTSEEEERRKKIDSNQDNTLLEFERKREQVCNDNLLAFENANTKLDYRIDMMQAPINIIMLDQKQSDPFAPDKKQITLNFPNRFKFKHVAKVLRPFKCTPWITNSIVPESKKICAPFVPSQDAVVLSTQLTSQYMEFVARIRFSSDVNKNGNSALYESIISQLSDLAKTFTQLSQFISNISAFNDVEAYVFYQMFVAFVSVCLGIKEQRSSNINLAKEIYTNIYLTKQNISVDQSGNYKFGQLDQQIDEKKKEKLLRSFIFAQMPVNSEFNDGVQTQNPINCVLNTSFIRFIQGDMSRLDNEIKELEQQKNNQLSMFDKIISETFYLLGEINGIGLVDIMAIMMALWLLPQKEFLAMFDGKSFERLYREHALRNSTVESRYSSTKTGYASISIGDSIKSMDKLVLNLLMIASDIIESTNITK